MLAHLFLTMDDLEIAVRMFLFYEAHGPQVLANEARRKMEEIVRSRVRSRPPTRPDQGQAEQRP